MYIENSNQTKFNHRQWQSEHGLNVTDMDFRQYDNAIGKFVCVDAITHFSQTPYQFGNGNPMYWADPSGLDGMVYGMAGQEAPSNPNPRGIDTFGNTNGGSLMPGNPYAHSVGAAWGDGGKRADFYGAEAIKVFSYLAMANGYTRAIFIEDDPLALSSGGIGGGFFDYIKGSVGVNGLKIFGDGGDTLAGNGVMNNDRGSGSIDVSNSFGGGQVSDLWNLGDVIGRFFNWFTTNRTITPTQPEFKPQPKSIIVPSTVDMQLYNYNASDYSNNKSFVHATPYKDTTVELSQKRIIDRINQKNYKLSKKKADSINDFRGF